MIATLIKTLLSPGCSGDAAPVTEAPPSDEVDLANPSHESMRSPPCPSSAPDLELYMALAGHCEKDIS